MFHALLNTVVGLGQGKLRSMVTAGAVLAGLAGVPNAAFARHHGFYLELGVPVPEVQVVPAAQVQCAPTNQVWVPAVYQTVTEKVWVPDVTTTQIQRVAVPAQVGCRDVVRTDLFGRSRIYREQVIISPAHIENQVVTVVVTPGHYELQTRQQLVASGHWETQAAPLTVVQTVPAN